jgi:hypothetical protein
MVSSTEYFTYSPLDPARTGTFRLLGLLPGVLNVLINCELTQNRRNVSTGPYETLSYSWGDHSLTSIIFVNGFSLPVMKDLEQALRSLQNDSLIG